MSLETMFGSTDARKFLKILTPCLTTAGHAEFNTHFLDLIEHVIRADQCMIFSYKRDRPRCYLSFSKRQKQSAVNTAQRYLRDYASDPLLAEVAQVRRDGQMRILTLGELRDQMPAPFYESFFASTGIADKITVLCCDGDEVLGLSFYRFNENGPFGISEDSLRRDFWALVSKIALMHYAAGQPGQLQSPLNSLSTREKEICEGILKGLTTDAIAWELDLAPSTINTYRKRAYEKLGVNSKSALFGLCNPG
ncbi:helix-turn-helix transcriptional regulator [Ruegeria sp.]|uniref:helix-turn-helix transcriptional regulator n=1 Tax=Ruegeria sp. TaxID=1879320 RepID=UPI0023262350|nr:helix-turn-helix transcriptional regulator [Ruegeria sp.]MDA7966332.1 helix-turn-helix transcriptional regulator [Ruegeria sp.]